MDTPAYLAAPHLLSNAYPAGTPAPDTPSGTPPTERAFPPLLGTRGSRLASRDPGRGRGPGTGPRREGLM